MFFEVLSSQLLVVEEPEGLNIHHFEKKEGEEVVFELREGAEGVEGAREAEEARPPPPPPRPPPPPPFAKPIAAVQEAIKNIMKPIISHAPVFLCFVFTSISL